MTPLILLLVAVSALTSLIGFYVYRQNPRSRQHRQFALLTACATAWSLTIAGTLSDVAPTLLMRLSFAAASLMPALILAIIRPVASPGSAGPGVADRILALTGLLWSAVSLSPLVVSWVRVGAGVMFIDYGPLHRAFGAYVLLTLALTAWITARAHRAASGQRRVQLKYLSLGFLVPAALVATTNLLVPLVFQTSRLSPYGPLAALLMITMIGHAIIRHRLMDIRVAIRRGAVYAVSVAAAGGLLVMLLLAARAGLADDRSPSAPGILLALVVAVLFQPIKNRIQLAFDRYLYREPCDYQRTIGRASRALASTIDLPQLLVAVGDVVRETFRVGGVAIYLLDRDDHAVHLSLGRDGGPWPERLGLHAPPVRAAADARRLIFRDDLGGPQPPHAPSGLLDSLDALGADVVVPLVAEDQLVGLILVGPKRSGDSFFSDDADLLTTLGDQAAVAFRNAQAHRRVVELSAYLQQILSQIESGVVAVDEGGLVTLVNGAAGRILGRPAAPTRRQPMEDIPGPLARLLDATLRDGASRSQVEIALPDGAGRLVPFACSTARLRGAQDVPVGAVAVFSDLSRLKELESDRRRAERLASLEAIASGLVHEIRNPLVAVRTFTQLIPARFDDPAFREQCPRVVARELQRVDSLLTRFRTLAAPWSAAPMETMDVRDPIRAALEALGPRLEERGISVRRVGDGAACAVLGNASQLEQLFGNLCLNAAEAMGAGGEITVRIAELTGAGGRTLRVEVADTGPGIPDPLLDSIFDPFVTTKAGGTGLGLAICRGIADAHHATLGARNNGGRGGATFTLEFPGQVGRLARVAV